MKALFKRTEFFLGLVVLGICIVFGSVNQSFFSAGNLFNLLDNSVETGLFAVGVLIVIISGGIDVSFTAIAIFSIYLTVELLNGVGFQGGVIWTFILAGLIGTGLGFVNSIFIAFFKLPTLIVTLGTMSLFQGFMLVFLGTKPISGLPQGLNQFTHSNVLTIATKSGSVHLPSYVLLLVGFSVIVWLLLNYTILGRGIYALGGDPTAAGRIGFNPIKIQIFIYCFVGFISGIVGVVHSTITQDVNPFDLVGTELNVIAAVVLGGARITGGHGNVVGTLLGVLLVDIINNSLVLVGVPSYWQQAVVGVLILIGVGVTAMESRREAEVSILEG